MNFEVIKRKFKAFALDEANAFTANQKPDLENQQKTYDQLLEHFSNDYGWMGIVRLRQLKSPMYYRRALKNLVSYQPRTLYKITQYKHPSHQNIWVIYSSERNNNPGYTAFFMLRQVDKLVITQQAIWSNFESEGTEYDWSYQNENSDLTFEALSTIIKIERYIEPTTEIDRFFYWKDQ